MVRARTDGEPIRHTSERSFDAAAWRAFPAVVAARAIFRRAELSRAEEHHAHARPAYGLRERALPEHGRMLGASHRDVHDPRQHLHARVRLLRRSERQAAWAAGRRRARTRGGSGRADGPALRRGHLGESRRSTRWRRRDFRAHDFPDSPPRSGMQNRGTDSRFSRRLDGAPKGHGGAPRGPTPQHGNRAAALSPRAQRRGLRAFARIAAARARNGAQGADKNRNDARPRRSARGSAGGDGRNRRAGHSYPDARAIFATDRGAFADRALRSSGRICRIQTARRADGLSTRGSRPSRSFVLSRLRAGRTRAPLALATLPFPPPPEPR